jgi:AraC-like DNA-binding protein
MRPHRSDPVLAATGLLAPAFAAARRAGSSPERIMRRLGLDGTSSISTVAPKLREADVRNVLDGFAAEVNDPLFGLSIAEELQTNAFGIFPYLGMTAPTVGDALASVAEFSHLLDGVTSINVHTTGGDATVVIRGSDPQYFGLQGAILFFAAVTQQLRRFCGQPVELECAWLPHALPDKQRLMRTVGIRSCELLQSSTGLVIGKEVAKLPLMTADAVLHGILREHGASLSPDALSTASYRTVLSDLVRKMFVDGIDVTTATVARRAGMSTRTMQRRLRGEGTSFDDIVETTSSQLAYQMLARGRKSVADVASALQYDDVSAFIRAFKRWTGMTPGDVARSALISKDY